MHNLSQHSLVHIEQLPHVCDTCGKRFRRKDNLKQHAFVHGGLKPHVCQTCGKGFVRKNRLTIHAFVHNGQKPYACEICRKRFSTQSDLKRHSVVHSREIKPHVCPTCGRRFSSKSDLKRHAVIHSSRLKSHVCDTCGMRFHMKNDLKRHSLIHTGQKPYLCGTCGKRFRTKHDLKIHGFTHSKQLSHVCETCGKEFRYIGYLVEHRRVHIEGIFYSCSTCGSKFKRKSSFNRHLTSCNKSLKIDEDLQEMVNNNCEKTALCIPKLYEPVEETVDIKNKTQSTTSEMKALFPHTFNLVQKATSESKAKESSIPQNCETFHGNLSTPKRGGQLSYEDAQNVELQSNISSKSSELHGHLSKINDSISCNNQIVPVVRVCSRENTLEPLQFDATSWSVHEQAYTSMNASSSSSFREFGETVACGLLPDNPSPAFVGWDYSKYNPSKSPKTFFDL